MHALYIHVHVDCITLRLELGPVHAKGIVPTLSLAFAMHNVHITQ